MLKIFRDQAKRVLHLSQEGYIKKILERFGMKEVKSMKIPLTGHFRLLKMLSQTKVEAQEMERVPYSSGVGILLYTMVCFRPDITHVVS